MDSRIRRCVKILVLPENIFDQIREIICDGKRGLETGVSLFGVRLPPVENALVYDYVVLAVAGPGPRATHRPAHYSSDTEYTGDIYQALQSALPSIEWLGELHVHPTGMTWLSGGDRETVREILHTTSDDTLRPREFIAGVMQRRQRGVEIHPFFFSREHIEGRTMCMKRVPAGSALVREARDVAVGHSLPLCAPFDDGGEAFMSKQEPPKEEPANGQAPVSQGWFAKILNRVRREKT